jgi:predicted nucleotidyltransferase
MSGLDKIRQHRTRIMAIAARYGAGHLRAFGSVVRNEDRPDSDIDLLVTMQPGRDLLDLVALAQELEALLHQKTDVISDAEISPYLKDRIHQEAVAI